MAIVEINAWGQRDGDPRVSQIKWELLWVAWAQHHIIMKARTHWVEDLGPRHWCLLYLEMPLAGRYGWFS